MGLYRTRGSRFWWMSYTMNDERYFESTKTTAKELANKIWKRREGEIALGLFKVGWPGERMNSHNCAKSSNAHISLGYPRLPFAVIGRISST